MDFSFTDEQDLLRDSVAGFLASRYDLAAGRKAGTTGPGWNPDIWRGFAQDLGILGAALPESAGGTGGGAVEMMIVSEELGRALVVEPYLESVVFGGGLLARLGGDRATALVGSVVEGDALVAVATDEPDADSTLHDVATTARRDGDDWVLDGAKIAVAAAPFATHLLVIARTSGERRDRDGLSVFVLARDGGALPDGVTEHPYRTVDEHRASDLLLAGVRVPGDALLGSVGGAWPSLAASADDATASLCAEAVGLMRTVLADTVEYTRQRQQFGAPLSSFQALQHRMVDMYLELEQAVAAMYLAVLHLDTEPTERALALSAAKATINRAARYIGQQAVQLHGGMGLTEELAVGHYYKRLSVIERRFGSSDFHRARYAALTR